MKCLKGFVWYVEGSQLTCRQSITVKNIYYKRYQKRKKWKRPKLSTRTHTGHVSNCRDILADHESEVEADERGRRRLAWLRGWLNRSSTMRQVPPSRWVNACEGTLYACIHVSTKGRWRRHRNGCIFALIKTAEPAEPYLWKVCVEGIDSKSGKRG